MPSKSVSCSSSLPSLTLIDLLIFSSHTADHHASTQTELLFLELLERVKNSLSKTSFLYAVTGVFESPLHTQSGTFRTPNWKKAFLEVEALHRYLTERRSSQLTEDYYLFIKERHVFTNEASEKKNVDWWLIMLQMFCNKRRVDLTNYMRFNFKWDKLIITDHHWILWLEIPESWTCCNQKMIKTGPAAYHDLEKS